MINLMIEKLITEIASLLWDRDQSRIKSEVSGVLGLGQNATVNLTPFFNLLCRSENETN